MKASKRNILIWGIGFLMPLWLVIADFVSRRLAGAEFSGRWLYVSTIAGALICAIAISVSALAVWQRIVFVLSSWTLLVGEVFVLGAFHFSRSGLVGTQ